MLLFEVISLFQVEREHNPTLPCYVTIPQSCVTQFYSVMLHDHTSLIQCRKLVNLKNKDELFELYDNDNEDGDVCTNNRNERDFCKRILFDISILPFN